MPWGAIEAVARLVNTLLEGVPPAQRTASAVAWFWMWWPLGKLFLSDAQEKQVEAIMAKIDGGADAPGGANARNA